MKNCSGCNVFFCNLSSHHLWLDQGCRKTRWFLIKFRKNLNYYCLRAKLLCWEEKPLPCCWHFLICFSFSLFIFFLRAFDVFATRRPLHLLHLLLIISYPLNILSSESWTDVTIFEKYVMLPHFVLHRLWHSAVTDSLMSYLHFLACHTKTYRRFVVFSI